MSKAKQPRKLKCVGWAVIAKQELGYAILGRGSDTRNDAIVEFERRYLSSACSYEHSSRKIFRAQRVYVEEWE